MGNVMLLTSDANKGPTILSLNNLPVPSHELVDDIQYHLLDNLDTLMTFPLTCRTLFWGRSLVILSVFCSLSLDFIIPSLIDLTQQAARSAFTELAR